MKLCPQCSEPFNDEAGYCPFDGATLARNADPLVGRTLAARYRLVRRLGSGGMAVVYLARHVMIERLSAIKLLRQDLGMSPSHRERFLREARAVNRINHPNIVEINDCGEDGGLVYLVMEYVEGQSLHEALARGRLAWARGARVALQIASALAAGALYVFGCRRRFGRILEPPPVSRQDPMATVDARAGLFRAAGARAMAIELFCGDLEHELGLAAGRPVDFAELLRERRAAPSGTLTRDVERLIALRESRGAGEREVFQAARLASRILKETARG